MGPIAILPVVAMAIISAATAAISGAIKAAPTRADVARKQRIKKLEQDQKQGTLGLTQRQIDDLQRLGMAPVHSAQREDLSREGDALATMDMGAGASVLQKDINKEHTRQAVRDVGLQIQKADIAEQRRQEDELSTLREIQDQKAKGKRAAVSEAVIQAGAAVSQGVQDVETAKKEGVGLDTSKVASSLDVVNNYYSNLETPEERAADYLTKYNVSEEEANLMGNMDEDTINKIFSQYDIQVRDISQ